MCTKYTMQGNFFLGRPEKVIDSDFFKKNILLFLGQNCQKRGFSSFMNIEVWNFSAFLHQNKGLELT